MVRKLLTSKRFILASCFALAALVVFILFVHPFLAINRPVKADTLVVEGWVPDYVVEQALRELQAGQYRAVFISGMKFEKGNPRSDQHSDSAVAATWLVQHGVPSEKIVPCPVAAPSFNRTSHMARAVRERMQAMNYTPQGVNVITLGPHARQTLLAYNRMLRKTTPVGIISYPKNDYDPARWWASTAGRAKTIKDFAGWLKELFFGLRS